MLGVSHATVGFSAGVRGVSSSALGTGVEGFSSAPDAGWGVKGAANGPNGVAVEADSAGVAFRGQNLGPCDANGCTFTAGTAATLVTGDGGNIVAGFLGAPSGWTPKFRVDSTGTGFFSGDLHVTGMLTKSSGSFKIDHPLDPENKYLYHSFVESPDMMNIYNGNVVTDKRGVATVKLPDYFEALNEDFRYQLTVIGQFAQAIVAKRISQNGFVVRTSKPFVEVSWQVTGIRHDAYAQAHRIKVEELKPNEERGHYLYPELFGQPSVVAASSNRTPHAGSR